MGNRIIFIIVAVVFVNNVIVAGEPPDTLWTRTFGGTNIDIAHSVRELSDGSFILTGYTRSFGTQSGRRIWLIKTSSTGDTIWNNTFGGSNDDEGYDVMQTNDGGYVIAGYTKSFGNGGKDVYLVKTDSVGIMQWSRTYGGQQDDEGYSFVQTSDNGFLIVGATSSYGAGGRDAYLIKTDSMGLVIWTKTIGGLSSDGAWSVENTTDGGFVFCGWTFSYGPGSLGNAWLVKIDSAGNLQWQNSFGGSEADRAQDLFQTSDGGYVLTGYTESFGAGLYDMLLIKTDSNGNQQWLKTFGGSGRDYGQSIRETFDGGFIVAGYTLSIGAGGEDFWLVKTDLNGNLVWEKTLGGIYSDVAYSVFQTIDGGYVLTGHTLSFGAGLHDVWLIKVKPDELKVITGITFTESFQLMQNYPNPFNPSTTISFNLSKASPVKLLVFDISGRLIKVLINGTLSGGFHNVEFNGTDLPSGAYFFRLESNKLTETRTMVLTK
ncbi:T9SS type A sorting domain-containing protein [Ignavibacteria bacterium CHB1]|mgnify:CR=1 FL=1|nr:MAG: T9SS C-terminal target domain-containing protein [Chlorobiota bacterium]MBV6399699.1 hypothetical protein [Ignavibacteria bacterium]MCC6885622.1 T9SS type A sorting domain-containing protein [Ignavibacteriales bacterium]MCE7953997.1 T9SS C-terminal target domain-containing protein [Chlorobi bacterium CHB7]MDL1887897.1 T9SS type A sorting domain-containing protein [Ignavibacteria bacterium CHB1]RIK47530.1 MAG: hypothetical protein DCC60_10425 [Ignavibacteriota bacterium]